MLEYWTDALKNCLSQPWNSKNRTVKFGSHNLEGSFLTLVYVKVVFLLILTPHIKVICYKMSRMGKVTHTDQLITNQHYRQGEGCWHTMLCKSMKFHGSDWKIHAHMHACLERWPLLLFTLHFSHATENKEALPRAVEQGYPGEPAVVITSTHYLNKTLHRNAWTSTLPTVQCLLLHNYVLQIMNACWFVHISHHKSANSLDVRSDLKWESVYFLIF